MVLSRIILAAFLAFGSITVALPVVPGDVAGTTPTPGSGVPLPHLQGSLAVGDTAVPLQDGTKGVSPLVGGSSSPHGNEAGGSISRRQGSSAVPPLERRGNYLSSSQKLLEEYQKQEYTKQGRDPTIEKLRKAFEEGESPENLRAILRDSPEPGIH
ncbi:hypothetical protein GG344DRAFT_69482 [Lentinula edodes]|nr:hypothetical protein GG344DRAFT_69482 [Lentinula edodes]